jgi:hypothetical protein
VVTVSLDGITTAELAAGAVWVQCVQALAAAQTGTGWIQIVAMRTLTLLGKQVTPNVIQLDTPSCAPLPARLLTSHRLGKQDSGASKAFSILVFFGSVVVALSNVALYAYRVQIDGTTH